MLSLLFPAFYTENLNRPVRWEAWECFCPLCFILTHPNYVMQLLCSSLPSLVLRSAARTPLKAGRGSLESVLVLSLLTLSLFIIYILSFFFKLNFPLVLSVSLVIHSIFMFPLWRQPWLEASGCLSDEAIIQKHPPWYKDGLVLGQKLPWPHKTQFLAVTQTSNTSNRIKWLNDETWHPKGQISILLCHNYVQKYIHGN